MFCTIPLSFAQCYPWHTEVIDALVERRTHVPCPRGPNRKDGGKHRAVAALKSIGKPMGRWMKNVIEP